jgi:hypothetical protein
MTTMTTENTMTFTVRMHRTDTGVSGNLMRHHDGTRVPVGSILELTEVLHGEMDLLRPADDSALTALLDQAMRERQEASIASDDEEEHIA